LVVVGPARALSRRLGIKKTGEFSNAISGENYTAAESADNFRREVRKSNEGV